MEQVSDVPGVKRLDTNVEHRPNLSGFTLWVQHELQDEEIQRISRAMELLLPTVFRLAAKL